MIEPIVLEWNDRMNLTHVLLDHVDQTAKVESTTCFRFVVYDPSGDVDMADALAWWEDNIGPRGLLQSIELI